VFVASLAKRLPFFYGWVIVAVSFVTMSIGVNARTAYSLFFPPIVAEFGWDRGLAAGAFSFGFLISALISPIVGRLVDRQGPLLPIEFGACMIGGGLLAAVLVHEPWQLYLTLGVMVGAGANCLGYTVQSLYLPHWFTRNRGLAIGIAFAGAGLGSIVLLPWLQSLIADSGWRSACWSFGLLALAILVPLNLLVKGRPRDLGLEADGHADGQAAASAAVDTVVDRAWAATDWTLRRAIRTARFWYIALGFFCALWVWYAVQVHQTKYLLEIGFSPMQSAWALGLVSVVGIPGQIAMGFLSDRIGREPIWLASSFGFVLCCLCLIAMKTSPTEMLLYLMIGAQGLLGYGMTSVMGPMVLEIFQGRHYGSIFGIINLASIAGGAAGPWVTGKLYDLTGSYNAGFSVALGFALVSAIAIWLASPRKVRLVPGRVRRPA